MVVCQSCQTLHFLWVDDRAYRKIPKPRFSLTRRFNIDQKPHGVSIWYRNLILDEGLLIGMLWLFVFAIVHLFPAPWTINGVLIDSNPILLVIWVVYSVFIIVSVGFAYALVKEIVNRKSILLMSKSIQISEEPIPSIERLVLKNPLVLKIAPKFADRDFSHKQMIDISAIEQVYSTKKIVETEDGSYKVYDVRLENRNGAVIVLIERLSTHELAHFIEQGIKQLYHVETQPHPSLGTFKFSD